MRFPFLTSGRAAALAFDHVTHLLLLLPEVPTMDLDKVTPCEVESRKGPMGNRFVCAYAMTP